MEKIAKKSTNRIASNSYFNRTKNSIKNLIFNKHTKIAELVTIDTAFRSQSEIDGMWSEIDELDTESNNLIINNSNLNNYLPLILLKSK
jgi:carboxyl-terminal processing protease